MNGSAEDVEAAALLCELRASPVVHTSTLYSTPRPYSHVANERTHDLRTHEMRLPSPHEILAGREWDRRSERVTSPLAPLAKRKRETDPPESWPVRRPRPSDDEEEPEPEPAPPRRGYLSMSALGVLEAPPRKEYAQEREPDYPQQTTDQWPESSRRVDPVRAEWTRPGLSLPSLSDIRLPTSISDSRDPRFDPRPASFSDPRLASFDPRLPSSDARHWPPPRHPPEFALRTRTPSDLHAPSDVRSSPFATPLDVRSPFDLRPSSDVRSSEIARPEFRHPDVRSSEQRQPEYRDTYAIPRAYPTDVRPPTDLRERDLRPAPVERPIPDVRTVERDPRPVERDSRPSERDLRALQPERDIRQPVERDIRSAPERVERDIRQPDLRQPERQRPERSRERRATDLRITAPDTVEFPHPQKVLSPYPTSTFGFGPGPSGSLGLVGADVAKRDSTRGRVEPPTSTLVSTAGFEETRRRSESSRRSDLDEMERARRDRTAQFTQVSPPPTAYSRVKMPSFSSPSHPATSPVQSTHPYSAHSHSPAQSIHTHSPAPSSHAHSPATSTHAHSPVHARPTPGLFRAPSSVFTAGLVQPPRGFEPAPAPAPKPRPEPIEIEDSPEPEPRPSIPDFRPLPGFDSRARPGSGPDSRPTTAPEMYSRPRAPSEVIPRTPLESRAPFDAVFPRASETIHHRAPSETTLPRAPEAIAPRAPEIPRAPETIPPRAPSETIPSREPFEPIPPRAPSETIPPRTPSDAASVPRVSSEGRHPRVPPEFQTDTEPPSSPLSEDETADEDERAEGMEWQGRRMEDRTPRDGRRSPRDVEIRDVWEREKDWREDLGKESKRDAFSHPALDDVPRAVVEPPPVTPVTREPLRLETVLPRLETVQTPRHETVQTPRHETVQTPRFETVQTPRHETVQTPRLEVVQTPSRLETLAQIVHGDMQIYPVNAPPAPKTVHHHAPTPKSKPTLIGPAPKPRTSSMSTARKPVAPVSPTAGPSREHEKESKADSQDTGQIRCKCRSEADDRGRMVLCDGCGNWQHLKCYGLDEKDVQGRWMCGMCGKTDGMDWERAGGEKEEKEKEEVRNGTDVEMDSASVASVDGKDKGKERVGAVKKEPVKPKVVQRPGMASKANHKAKSTNPLFPTKPLTPTIRTITAPPKKTNATKPGTPKASQSKPLSSSSARPPVIKSKTPSSRPASIDPSPRVRARPLSPAPTPPAPQSPRASSPPAAAAEPVEKAVETEQEDNTGPKRESTPKLEKASVPSPVALQTALPPSSPRPPTPPAPSPPRPTAPGNDVDDDDINAAHWATEYDHISANIVDASLRERLRSFGRDHVAKRVESKSTEVTTPTLTPFTSSEPVFLASSQPTSLVRVKEIKPPPNQHTPTYGVLATGPIAQGALVLEYRCALSDAHAYISNKAHQYALLGTGTKYVRLVPAPLDICLDARVMGNEGRFVRCGCWPNAVVRPFICVEGDDEHEARFGVFALRQLEKGEEIVLGWEWTVEHVVHKLVRDEKLGPSEDEDVLSDSDTKRLWDILDLLRSLSMTCACKPDSTNCALSFGRMLLEDADSVGHARDLGPLVGYKRYEHGFEPSLHAVSSKTRRGRKSAGRGKLKQSLVRPPSPPPKVPTPPPKEPSPPPTPAVPPEPPTPVVAEPPARDPTPPPPPVTTPAKRALGKLAVPSSPLSEPSELEHDTEDPTPRQARGRSRGATLGRGKHRRRIESPSPEEDVDMESRGEPVKVEVTSEPNVEAEHVVEEKALAPEEKDDVKPVVEAAEEANTSHEPQGETVAPEPQPEVQPVEPIAESKPDPTAADTSIPGQEAMPEPNGTLEVSVEPPAHDAAAHEHDLDSEPTAEAPKKVSFLDWARRRRATHAGDTKDLIPSIDVAHSPSGAPLPEPHTEMAATATDLASSADVHTSPDGPPATESEVHSATLGTNEPTIAASPFPPAPPELPKDDLDAPASLDVTMHDAPPEPHVSSSDSVPTSAKEHEEPAPTSLPANETTTAAEPPSVEAMELDPAPPASSHESSAPASADHEPENQIPPPSINGSQFPAASHTPHNHVAPLPDTQSTSSPEVPAPTKQPSDFDPLKPPTPAEGHLTETTDAPTPSDIPPVAPRARTSTDVPEEGEITIPRAPASSYTPSNGSPAATSIPLPSGPRDRAPPTQPRKFSAGPPPGSSPSGSSAPTRPGPPPYPRPPPSGPSRGIGSSPRAPPSAPRADRRPPPTGPRERDRDREWERDRERDRDRDRDPRGRGRGYPPRGPSSERGWRSRGRGSVSRGGGSWRP